MKDLFFEYYKPTENFFKELWEDPIYAFDTNVLLDVFRSSEDGYKELIKIFTKLKEQIWIPYQVAMEYHKNLNKTIRDQYKKYDKPLEYLRNFEESVRKTREHPFIEYEKEINVLRKRLNEGKEKLKNLISKNTKADEISKILGKNIGDKFTEDELSKLYKEADDRYRDNIPPGFEDENKSTKNKYGDFIIWKELLEKSKTDKKNIIFVTNDTKCDWFVSYIEDSKMPHPFLKKEFREITQNDIYIYTLDNFLKELNKRKQTDIKGETIDEIKNRRNDYLKLFKIINEQKSLNDLVKYNIHNLPLLKIREEYLNASKKALEVNEKIHSLKMPYNELLENIKKAYSSIPLNDKEK